MVEHTPSVISALITPMKENREIDFPALEQLVVYEMEHGADGFFYCCGSSGEGLLLSPDERKKK